MPAFAFSIELKLSTPNFFKSTKKFVSQMKRTRWTDHSPFWTGINNVFTDNDTDDGFFILMNSWKSCMYTAAGHI